MSNHQLLMLLVGGSSGFVLSVLLTWGLIKWIEYRDMTRIERWTRKRDKKR
jgi:hypothetical protein